MGKCAGEIPITYFSPDFGGNMTLDISGIETSYLKSGSGEPLLLLPGWGATAAAYNLPIKQLSEKYTVYALEMPGFGVTPEPKEAWDVDDYADFVTEFIEKTGIDNFIIAGHSYGGRVILKLCSRENKFTIKKVVLIDAAGLRHELSPEAKARQEKYKKLKKFYNKKLVSTFCPSAVEKLQKKYGSSDYANASPIMRETLVKSVNEDLESLLPCVPSGAVLIWGRNDTATPVSDGEKMKGVIPDSTLTVIEGAGHFPFIDQPFEFMKVIRDV